MPYILTGDTLRVDTSAFLDKDYGYDYPNDLDLRPSSELHTALVSRLLRYGLESSRLTTHRHSSWNALDTKLTAYIATSGQEKEVQLKDKRKPVSIVFPYSYAILETLLSYFTAAFLQEPIFRYEGMGPEDIAGAILLEKVIMLHCVRSKIALNLHTMFRDACAYGFGAVTPQWFVKTGLNDRILFEGNALENIDPYNYLPDPSVPVHDVQRGEFVGWLDRTNYLDLLSDESSGGDLFNVKYLTHVQNKKTTIYSQYNSNRTRLGDSTYNTRMDRIISDPVDQFNLYVKLVPEQWQIGPGQRPEKWLFTLAGDSVIIRAMPLGLTHNMFPVCVSVPDFDGYSPVAFSRMEILSGMQVVIDWLFNSHIANVRKVINDLLVVDPYLINISDLKDPEAGGLVRLRRPAWGKGVKDAVMQLNVTDVTRQHIADVAAIIQYMQVIGGTDNPLMGNVRQGGPERLTSVEFQGTARGAVNRMERMAKVVGVQGMQDIGTMFAYHTQQFTRDDLWVRSVGEWPETVTKQFAIQNDRVLVRPGDLQVAYDLLVRDGSIPGGNFSDAWLQLFQTIGSNEMLLQHFDVVRIFSYIATNLGAKNVEDFARRAPQVQTKVMPDEVVGNGVARGDLVALLGGAT